METKATNVSDLSNFSVCILLAAYNGGEYIRDQIESILLQSHINWSVFVNIDKSDDNTESIVREFESRDSRILLLKTEETFGSAGKNFYDLLKNAPIDQYDYVAFCDQDDIWQHENNDTGANSGLAATLMRLRLFKNGWYLNQVYLLEDYLSTRRSLNNNFGSRGGLRIRWLWMFVHARRSKLHSIILCICMILRVIK